MRLLTYAQAIREAHAQLLHSDPRVFICGQGVWNPWYAGKSLLDLDKEFGRERVLDCPVSENATTGAAIGAAIVGMRPIVFHARMDFMLLAMDPIINQAANWSYLFGGQAQVPIVIRTVINRGGEQGAQHSQALHAMLAHVPGLKVVMPATPYDAKGLLTAAVYDGSPVVYIDDRWLYETTGDVPEELYEVPIGKAALRRSGSDVTLVAGSTMVPTSLAAAEALEKLGIDVELVDLRSIKPWDRDMVFSSVGKTGRLVIADAAWLAGSVAGEIAATVAEELFHALKAPILRVCLPDIPAPTSTALEATYYIRPESISAAVQKVLHYA